MRRKLIKMFHGVTVSQTCLCGLLAAALVVTAVPFTAQAAEEDNEASVSIGSVKPVNPWDGTVDTDWYDKSGTEYHIQEVCFRVVELPPSHMQTSKTNKSIQFTKTK